MVVSDGGCVLIVDDEEDIRETLREVIEMAGCSAMTAANGAAALAILAEHRPCLVILDLLMPIMGGREMLEAMSKQPTLADLPVVISTSAPERAPIGFPLLKKPLDLQSVWDWIRKTCTCTSHSHQ